MPPVSAGLGGTVAIKSSIGGLHACRVARHSENLFLIHNMNSICRLCKFGLITNIVAQLPKIGFWFPTKIFE